jgi:hypothetical protein
MFSFDLYFFMYKHNFALKFVHSLAFAFFVVIAGITVVSDF